jgi:hypothetical protein
MQPLFKHVPPTCSFSNKITLNPFCAALIAATYPAGPAPIIPILYISIPFSFLYYSLKNQNSHSFVILLYKILTLESLINIDFLVSVLRNIT